MTSDTVIVSNDEIHEEFQQDEIHLAQIEPAADGDVDQDIIEELKELEELDEHLAQKAAVDDAEFNDEVLQSQGLSYSERNGFDEALSFQLDSQYSLLFDSTALSYETVMDGFELSGFYDGGALSRNSTIQAQAQADLIMPSAPVDPYNYIYGTVGADALVGTSGMDKIYLLADDDTVTFSRGADIIYGGDGVDTYDFSAETADFTVNLDTGSVRVNGAAYGRVYEMEDVIGGSGDDVITGNDEDNDIAGGSGDDRIVGSAGNDVLDGEGGTNTLDYSDQTDAITLNLATNSATGAGIGTDSIFNFSIVRMGDGDDDVRGSAGADTFYDGGGDDVVRGGNGDDIFYAGAGDDDLYGEGGDDWIYFDTSADVTVNLATNSAFSAETGTDLISSFTRAFTGSGNDNITGCGCNNIINSGAGDDVIDAAGGTDVIYSGSGADTITGGSGADTFMFMAADGLDDVDTITDFNTGQGDAIDISDVLSGYYTDGVDDIHDFVSFVVNGGDMEIHVDLDGAGGDYAATAMAIITGGAGLDMDTLIGNNDLIVAEMMPV